MRWPNRQQATPRARAVTLVELLVTVAVIGLLAALLLPSLGSAREAARRVQCANNLKQLGLALSEYETVHSVFPIGCIECRPPASPPPGPLKRIAWNVATLPYIDQDAVWRQFDYTEPAKAVANRAAVGEVVTTFLCPSTSREMLTSGDRNRNGQWEQGDDMAFTDYGGIYGVEGPGRDALPQSPHFLDAESLGVMLYELPTSPAEIVDGLAHTVAIAECTGRDHRQQAEWANGHNCFAQHQDVGVNSSRDNEIHSDHPDIAGALFCDAHVQFLDKTIDKSTLLALLTRAGEEVVDGP